MLATSMQEQLALAELIGTGFDRVHEMSSALHADGFTLEPHPFGLDTSKRRLVHIVADPGCTDVSVKGMLAVARVALQTAPRAEPPAFKLRIIRGLVRITPQGVRHHMVFFEIEWADQVYLCGGCTDHSGEGGYGRQRLETVFAFMSRMYAIPIEDVEVSESVTELAQERMRREQHRLWNERRAG